jgi:5-methylcytosine-specific restriction endonuclease McrA
MSGHSKHPRFRLDTESYRRLRQLVLKRDHWRCQFCGCIAGLEVHHVIPRGRLGGDYEENLITLCGHCHLSVHEHYRRRK